ncbi:MAG: thioesterase domain-containing protein [Verrucomicrobiales bacterium]|jgi:thioesterase domain-containing protein
MIQARDAHEQAMADYKPQFYSGKVTLFVSAAVDYKFERSTLSGWEGMAQGGIDWIECPGSHLTMFESPNVATLVASAQRTIDNAVVAAGFET